MPTLDTTLVFPHVSISGLSSKEIARRLRSVFQTIEPGSGADRVSYAQAREFIREVIKAGKDYLIYKFIDKLEAQGNEEPFRSAVTQFQMISGTAEALMSGRLVLTRTFSCALELEFGSGFAEAASKASWPLPKELTEAYAALFGLDRCLLFSLAPTLYRSWEFKHLTAKNVLDFTEESRLRVADYLSSGESFAAPELIACKRGPNIPPSSGGIIWCVFAGALAIPSEGPTPFRMELERRALNSAVTPGFGTEIAAFSKSALEPLRAALPGLRTVKPIGMGSTHIVSQLGAVNGLICGSGPSAN